MSCTVEVLHVLLSIYTHQKTNRVQRARAPLCARVITRPLLVLSSILQTIIRSKQVTPLPYYCLILSFITHFSPWYYQTFTFHLPFFTLLDNGNQISRHIRIHVSTQRSHHSPTTTPTSPPPFSTSKSKLFAFATTTHHTYIAEAAAGGLVEAADRHRHTTIQQKRAACSSEQ